MTKPLLAGKDHIIAKKIDFFSTASKKLSNFLCFDLKKPKKNHKFCYSRD